MTRQKRLGRGLAALLGDPTDQAAEVELREDAPDSETVPFRPRLAESDFTEEAAQKSDASRIALDQIDRNPYQPRHNFDDAEIASLAESLKQHDILQPIVVRQVGERFQLISGERRLRAAGIAGWDSIPALVREADDRLVAELAIVENLQRQDLNPLEKAISFQRYLEQHNATQGELADRIKVDRSTIANLVRLLDLPDAVKASVHSGELSQGHARALLPLGDEVTQCEFATRIVRDGWSVRSTEQAVQDFLNGDEATDIPAPAKKGARTKSKQVVSLEEDLRMALGTKVDIKQSTKGGKIVIHFKNADEFDRLNEYLLADVDSDRRAA
ncbi:ParB/RepB/Spo0J family partition protein [Bremerella cremea]|uniref:Chromosome partitioning protein ParB n=1 Tax=Blastopirellula marina TaxID=124 RepID=A0A2S8G6I3_9BACT|nr:MULTISPECIES: ParB/RepB/Spo0J family partition protein [Pirellulaceae]PQO39900.1 chromosome partitioning protein ParB [Blastopirellula marina]RCS51366.1 ParB/RepB/Spo0J family partition protein [Bremerella cremea]